MIFLFFFHFLLPGGVVQRSFVEVTVGTAGSPRGIDVADVNQDGRLDIVSANAATGTVSMYVLGPVYIRMMGKPMDCDLILRDLGLFLFFSFCVSSFYNTGASFTAVSLSGASGAFDVKVADVDFGQSCFDYGVAGCGFVCISRLFLTC